MSDGKNGPFTTLHITQSEGFITSLRAQEMSFLRAVDVDLDACPRPDRKRYSGTRVR